MILSLKMKVTAVRIRHKRTVQLTAQLVTCDYGTDACYTRVGDRQYEGVTLALMGRLHVDAQRFEQGEAALHDACALFAAVGSKQVRAETLGVLARAVAPRSISEARGLIEEGRAVLEEMSDDRRLASFLVNGAKVEAAHGVDVTGSALYVFQAREQAVAGSVQALLQNRFPALLRSEGHGIHEERDARCGGDEHQAQVEKSAVVQAIALLPRPLREQAERPAGP